MNQRKYFGTDGIRGRVGEWPINADFMLRLGRALGTVLAQQGAGRRGVVIGKDTRISGYMFESALEAGLVAAGVDVHMFGPMPTPAVAFLTRSLRAEAGIVISASHNPHYDNGIKFFSATGEKLSDEIELAIEDEVDAPFVTVPSEQLGKARRVDDAVARYAEFCKSTVAEDFSLLGMKIVLDCAHGATYQVAPKVFAELGAQVIAIGDEPDGFNINRDVGSTHPDALQSAVLEHCADLGIAFDGDGDRVQLVDRHGVLADGDDILYVLARDCMREGRLKGPVVGTLMSNYGLEQALAALDMPLIRANVGDRFVLQQLKQHGGTLGGETSGHILCLDRATTGDGIVAALAVLEALLPRGRISRWPDRPAETAAGDAQRACRGRPRGAGHALSAMRWPRRSGCWKGGAGVPACIGYRTGGTRHRGGGRRRRGAAVGREAGRGRKIGSLTAREPAQR